MAVEGGCAQLPAHTSFAVNRRPATSVYHSYPPPLAAYEDLIRSRELFMDSLRKLHLYMGTKFMIPIVGGRDLDLHRLFVEVTSRGGIAKIMKDKKWKEVTAVFSFPSSATNASFILRKYYVSLLYHYEQIYFFEAKCWTPSASVPQHGLPEYLPSATQQAYTTNAETSTPEARSAPPAGSSVCGVIDGKFDSGYLVTVKIGPEDFKGVLYQVPNSEIHNLAGPHTRRKRRKRSEIRRRDPAHPKPNRSGYNFFFAKQHARLKPHYHGRDREISRIIGDSWNKLQEPERAFYQEKALKDKERYKMEMEVYRERLRTGEITGSTVPVQLHHPVPEVKMMDLNSNVPFEGEENNMSSDKSDKSNLEGYGSADKDSDFEECSQVEMGLRNVNIEVVADEAFHMHTRLDEKNSRNDDMILVEGGISLPVEGIEQPPSIADESFQML